MASAGIGPGSAALLRHLSHWSLHSLSGFTGSVSRTLEALSDSAGPGRRQQGSADVRGGGGLLGWFGRSVVRGVTLPLSGALELLSTASAVVAASVGFDQGPSLLVTSARPPSVLPPTLSMAGPFSHPPTRG